MADASIPLSQTTDLSLLDDSKPLRDSLLWQLQSNFYQQSAMTAWSDAIVPSFVTSSAWQRAA